MTDIGVIACPDLVDDVEAIAEGFIAGVAELREAAALRSRSTLASLSLLAERRPPSGGQPLGQHARSETMTVIVGRDPKEEQTRSHPLSGVLRAPGYAVGQARRAYRDLERVLARRAPARALTAVPRTGQFLGATVARRYREGVAGLPVPAVSPGLAAQVAIDETLLAVAAGPNRMPRRADYERVGAELAHARLLFETRGWLDDPASYHRAPPPLVDPAVDQGWALGQHYERLLFNSGWAPRPDEPGAERWASYEPNHTAVATILRHRGPPRPWVVAVHGFACGYPFMDFVGLHALRLHRDLGLNVAMPVLPLHGPREDHPSQR